MQALNGQARGAAAPQIVDVRTLVASHPHQREPIVGGLLRRGETANLIAAPKVGKSWLAYSLALSIATGDDWLGKFPCIRGRVLIVDLELHSEVIAGRIPSVARAMGLQPDEYDDAIEVLPLRGKPCDLHAIDRMLRGVTPGTYDLVVLDAWYRAIPPGVSESDNAAVMGLYNAIDGIAERLDCCWLNVHHASKGSQTDKAVTDVGSGAGSQSRAADAHIVLRPHEDEGATVLEAVVRSWAPVDPLPLRWVFPRWLPDGSIDPTRLKGARTRGEERQTLRDNEGMQAIRDALADGPATMRELRSRAALSKERCERLVNLLAHEGELTSDKVVVRGNECREYRLADQS